MIKLILWIIINYIKTTYVFKGILNNNINNINQVNYYISL